MRRHHRRRRRRRRRLKRTRKFRPTRHVAALLQPSARLYAESVSLGGKRVSIGSCEIPGGLTRAIYHARSVFAYVVGEPHVAHARRDIT